MTAAAKGAILVTGSNGGLSSAIIEQIVSKPEFSNYHGLYTVRDPTKAETLNAALKHGASHTHDIIALDLTKLDSVRRVAERINARVSAGEIPPIRAIVLGAGLLDFGNQSWTDDGLDMTFAANYLGHWLLTLLLLKSVNKTNGRIVVIGSQSHDPKDPRNARTKAFDDSKYQTFVPDASTYEAIAKGTWSSAAEDPSWRNGYRRYGAAKLFLIMMQHELQARLNADAELNKISVVGVDPGAMMTGFQRSAPWVIRVLLFQFIYPLVLYFKPDNETIRLPSRSASDVLEAAFATVDHDGSFKDKYLYGTTPMETSAESRNEAARELVWKETVKLVGLKLGETVLAKWE
ncbi:hypothetical protein G7054_g7473 [Neopestalotiopsis clavispora]|nr:hypothetical protein G7054_g7473 [Neopestalotiopsis clavispora]